MEYQSGLVILVPESEPLVSEFRSKYDSSAKDGMPAHITINFPFLPIEQDLSVFFDQLVALFSQFRRFEYSLVAARRWPGVLYLEPSPAQPFVDLINGVVKQFPDSPPYGGEYGDVVPHLTVATADDDAKIEIISQQFATASAGRLPITALASEIWLVDNREGSWVQRRSFPLGNGNQYD